MSELSFQAMTPTAFLDRSAAVRPDAIAVVDGSRRWTYAEHHDRCLRMSGALHLLGVAPGARVAVLAPNSHVLLEAHCGVPFAGAVLVSLNIRLSAPELGYILAHSGAEVLLYDGAFADLARAAAKQAATAARLVNAEDEYEEMLAGVAARRVSVLDERALLAINYTSGTTGRPKGVMYHHRGAYLQALAMATHSRLMADDAYLWTLPMFHCNGWCFTWAVTAAGAAHVCLYSVAADDVWQRVHDEHITHLCAAPTVLTAIVHAREATAIRGRRLWVGTGGAPPSPTLLARSAQLGMEVTHLYGLTETFGPTVICDWHTDWDALPDHDQARLKARQGVANIVASPVRVLDGNGEDVPRDGLTSGEVAVRGNTVMLGYYRDPQATEQAAPDGWFRTGDLAVLHPDGYLELRDRAKDVIISGGENIASVEIEIAILSHPAVLEAAVIAVPHEHWGERPAAYVTTKEGISATEEEIRAHVRTLLPGFKVPDTVTFGPLPKTVTGKTQKYILRDAAWKGRVKRIG